ncbi:MAG TPA: ferredoxin family protein [Desulfosalsimonadaceae bacterium]|nr:ferredoxin family protein [Desulfosalsimonadaceae bacterium]
MPKIHLSEKGCRGCMLCVDICPVDVFEFNEEKNLAEVKRPDDCIGCLSCYYACPSQCIEITEVEHIRPFYRIEKNVAFVEQFLQTKPADRELREEELDFAYQEVGILLSAFADAITEILGRGHKSVGRRAGTVAAAHLPEMYEEKGLDELLRAMRERFGASFDFSYTLSEDSHIDLAVQPCGLLQAVRNAGETPGKSDLCLLFHEYWAGLISAFTGSNYVYELLEAGDRCALKLQPKQ